MQDSNPPRQRARHESFLVWCGREGYLTIVEMVQRTDRDIEAYARMNPMRYRSAMSPRGYDGAKIHSRSPLWAIKAQNI